MASNASEYAEQVGRGFWTAYDDGAVFGRVECEECGADLGDTCEHDDDRDPAGAYEWAADVLDIDYVVGRDGACKGAEYLITFGGPNAWIDTRSGSLVVAWGSERATWALPGAMIGELEELAGELWDDAR